MKILQFINALTWGGAQTLLLDLGCFLRDQGHEVRIVAFRDGPVGAMMRTRGLPVCILGEGWLDLAGFLRLRGILRDFQPDVVHSHLFRATFWARLSRDSFPQGSLVTSIHGFETTWFHKLEKLMNGSSDRFIFPSRFLRDWYSSNIAHGPAQRGLVAYPGAVKHPPPAVRGPGDPIRIGTLSRLHPVKGVDLLLEACSGMAAEGKSFRLVIGGEGRNLENLRSIANRLGLGDQVEFAGPIQARREFLQNLDIFVAPSLEEAFGISICEAMERGVPVVASAVGGIPEIVREGIDGLLFPRGNAAECSRALRRLIDDPDFRLRLGGEARLRAATCFDRREALERHLQAYREAVRERPGKGERKVHFAVSSRELGGGERMALALASSLGKRGWRVSATCAGSPLSKEFLRITPEVSSASLRAGGLFFGLRFARDLSLRAGAAVSCHLNRAALVGGILRRIRGPLVTAHVHGLNRAVYYRDCDRLIAVSEAVGECLRGQGVPGSQITVVPNCIPGEAVVRDLPPGPTWTILIPAKLHPNKGHRWALDAISNNLHRLPDLRIWLLGKGPAREELERVFKSSPLGDRLVFWGFRSRLDRFYAQAHLILLPSLAEGIPLTLLEGMRWGIPCVATGIGGIPEIIEDRVNGRLVQPENAEMLVSVLETTLQTEEWKTLSKGAREKFGQVNRYEEMVDRFEELLSDNRGEVT